MSLQTCSLIICVFLAQMAAGTGVQFVMERHPDSYFCGHLQCLADFTHIDHGVSTFVEMAIYDITRVNSELRLTSVSTFDPDLYVDTTKSSAMGCTGTISRLKANLTLQLRHDIDCLYGVYKCQLDLATMSGHSEVLTEIVTPEYNHSYSRIAEVLSHFDRLTEMLNNFTILMNNQTAQISRLTSQSNDQTAQIKRLRSQSDTQTAQFVNQTTQLNRLASQSDDQTAQIKRLRSQSDIQTAQLVNQTTQLNRLASQSGDQTDQIKRLRSQSDTQTAQLVNQTTQLHRLASQSGDQTALIKRLRSHLDTQTAQLVNQTTQLNGLASQSEDQTAKLVDQTAQLVEQTSQLVDQRAHLHNISQRCDLDQADRKQRHETAENRLKLIQGKLDTVEELLHLGIEPVPDLRECRRGQLRGNGRQRIVLWGNITALCDTITDGGGWVIIQRRVRGDVDFYRSWADYKKGFGTPYTDLWIGNDIIHNLTSQGYNELRIDFVYNGTKYFAQYTNFSVADESSNYRITISGYSGNVYDSMEYHNGHSFSTFDRDNDPWRGDSCSVLKHGSWWYNECYRANLNGAWAKTDGTGINWYFSLSVSRKPLTFTEMKIRYLTNAIQ